jgi:hypothetical protein
MYLGKVDSSAARPGFYSVAAITCRDTHEHGVKRKVNRAQAARTLSRCIGYLLLVAGAAVQIARDWALTLGRSPIRHIAGQSRPRKQSKHKPHSSQAYKRAA